MNWFFKKLGVIRIPDRSLDFFPERLPYLSFWGTKWRRIFSLSKVRRSFAFAQDDMGSNLASTLTQKPPSFCHSEEQSDEESFLCRRCEDPSLSLGMTWEVTLLQHWRKSLPLFVILRNKVTKNLFFVEGAKILRFRSGWHRKKSFYRVFVLPDFYAVPAKK